MNDQYEVVPADEPSLEDYPQREETETHHADGTRKLDEFGAPVAAPVRIHDGVKDTKNR